MTAPSVRAGDLNSLKVDHCQREQLIVGPEDKLVVLT